MTPTAEATPSVGKLLREHIVGIDGITQDSLASALGTSRLTVNELMNDRRSVTAPMALRLGRVLGTTAEFWMNLQRDVDLSAARRKFADTIEALPVLREPKSREDLVADMSELFPDEPD